VAVTDQVNYLLDEAVRITVAECIRLTQTGEHPA
jgi:hypothetical protein